MPPSDQQGGSGGPSGGGERPEYKVYRSRPGFLSRLNMPDLATLRERLRGERKPEPERPSPPAPEPARKRPWLRWVVLAIVGWLLLSLLTFAVSAQIQKSKLDDAAGDELGGNPFLAADPQTTLVIGTDARAPGTDDGSVTSEECLEQQATGEPPSGGCPGFRADTLMLVRAGGTAFSKLSIPRDSVAEIPGQGVGKINAAYAFGGAALQVRTIEQFLDIDVDHVVIVDFEGFEDFINALGGVEIELDEKLCSEISGGAENGGFELRLDPGEHTLDGQQALTFARTRNNLCDPTENDLDRTRRQQVLLSAIKGRLTDPLRLPINFIKGPIIGWTAPRAFVSDFGALTMPQLLFASIIGGDDETEVLEPSGTDAAGNLIISDEERRQAVDKLLDG
jgi:LCP family protein required for cell wall assembly